MCCTHPFVPQFDLASRTIYDATTKTLGKVNLLLTILQLAIWATLIWGGTQFGWLEVAAHLAPYYFVVLGIAARETWRFKRQLSGA